MPKELKGMSQKGKRMVLAFKRGQTRTKLRREIAGTLPSHVVHSEHGKPVSSPIRAGWPQGRLVGVRVEDAGESEGLAVMARIGVETSPRSKEGRLPAGLSLQESL